MIQQKKRPWWLALIIFITSLPVFAFPTLLGLAPIDNTITKAIIWFYIIYVVLTAWLSWICWPERPYVTWILLALLLMSHIAVWSLVLIEK